MKKTRRFIFLTQKQIAIVDWEDYDNLINFKWCAHKGREYFYASRTINTIDKKNKTVKMHRVILNLSFEDLRQVDHTNHNTLDNRKSNIRICSSQENSRNRKIHKNNKSGYKGVSFFRGKWVAQINKSNGIHKIIGSFVTPEAAAQAYDKEAMHEHREFANINSSIEAKTFLQSNR